MEMAIVSVDQMVMIAANVELVVRDVFMVPAEITLKLAIQSEKMKPVANVMPVLA